MFQGERDGAETLTTAPPRPGPGNIESDLCDSIL